MGVSGAPPAAGTSRPCLFARGARGVAAAPVGCACACLAGARPVGGSQLAARLAALRACATSAAARANPPKVRPEQCSRYGWLAAMTRSLTVEQFRRRLQAHGLEGSLLELSLLTDALATALGAPETRAS